MSNLLNRYGSMLKYTVKTDWFQENPYRVNSQGVLAPKHSGRLFETMAVPFDWVDYQRENQKPSEADQMEMLGRYLANIAPLVGVKACLLKAE